MAYLVPPKKKNKKKKQIYIYIYTHTYIPFFSTGLQAQISHQHRKQAVNVKYSIVSETKKHLKRQQPWSDTKSHDNFAAIVQFLTCHFTVVASRCHCRILQKSSFRGCWLTIVVVWRSFWVQVLPLNDGQVEKSVHCRCLFGTLVGWIGTLESRRSVAAVVSCAIWKCPNSSCLKEFLERLFFWVLAGAMPRPFGTCSGQELVPHSLRSEKFRNGSSPRFLNVDPEFSTELSPECFEDFSRFVSWETEITENLP